MMISHHEEIIETWSSHNSLDFDYFKRFEAPEFLEIFWSSESRFRRTMEKYLDLTDTLEIASGTGRHSAQILNRCQTLTLLDTSSAAIAIARERFREHPHVKAVHSIDGKTIPLAPSSYSAVFSFDAMVHFEPITIASYLDEIARVLSPKGKVLLHHSNYSANPEANFKRNPHWRNFMTTDLMKHLASRAGLDIIEYQTFHWGPRRRFFQPKIDALTVLQHKAGNR